MPANSKTKVTILTLRRHKRTKEKTCLVTAYDYPQALIADKSKVDAILVGDSAGMTTHGYKNTIPVTMDEMEVTRYGNENTGETFSAADFAFGSTYSMSLTDRFSVGINGKYIQQSISNSHARGFALDLGTLFDTPFGFRLGTSISNFGPKLKMTGDDLLIGADVDEKGCELPLSIEKIPFINRVYPNPTNNYFVIEFNDANKINEINMVVCWDINDEDVSKFDAQSITLSKLEDLPPGAPSDGRYPYSTHMLSYSHNDPIYVLDLKILLD